ncbi:MAG: hypothetical protein HC908_14305 [Calothrix sp. SM1_7_51]|nr:hypothetical protein [Calothrix sp. SM1_7_51]
MEIKAAIQFIREWRSREGLKDLTPSQEKEAAQKLIFQKGWNLKEVLVHPDGILKLNEGLYMSPNLEVVKTQAPDNIERSQALDMGTENLFPWNPQDKRVFWSQSLRCDVRLTGDLNSDGNYYVVKVGEGYRRYPERGNKLSPKSDIADTLNNQESELLAVNLANWSDIKNCLLEKFIGSYPWSKTPDKSPKEVREQMETLARSKQKGLATYISQERQTGRGRFTDKQEFVIRMTAIYDSFPWQDFAELLDFSV